MKHIQIVSVGHSGSSLLNLILGTHPSTLSVGEVWSLQEVWHDDQCACGSALKECEFWEEVNGLISQRAGFPQNELEQRFPLRDGAMRRRQGKPFLTPSDLAIAGGNRRQIERAARMMPTLRRSLESARHNLQYLETAAEVSGRPMLIDSSKNPLRAKLLYAADPDTFKMIHMVRDGRGVANSWVKAYGQFTFRQATLQWYLRDRLIRLVTARIPREHCYLLRYEDLCAHPEQTMKALCDFMEIDYDPGMLQFQECKRHDVHINPRPLKSENRTIVLDEKWRRTVASEDLKAFRRLAGRWNRQYGYVE